MRAPKVSLYVGANASFVAIVLVTTVYSSDPMYSINNSCVVVGVVASFVPVHAQAWTVSDFVQECPRWVSGRKSFGALNFSTTKASLGREICSCRSTLYM